MSLARSEQKLGAEVVWCSTDRKLSLVVVIKLRGKPEIPDLDAAIAAK